MQVVRGSYLWMKRLFYAAGIWDLANKPELIAAGSFLYFSPSCFSLNAFFA